MPKLARGIKPPLDAAPIDDMVCYCSKCIDWRPFVHCYAFVRDGKFEKVGTCAICKTKFLNPPEDSRKLLPDL